MAKSPPQIILVMGVTGVGKSTFIKAATCADVVVGHDQSSCTAEVKLFQIPGTNVYLMDTPGFDDTLISDTDILNEIANALVDAFHDKAEIRGALYVHSVIEARMRGSGRRNVIMFSKVLGMDGMKNCRLVTTKWSTVDHATGVKREAELCEKKEFWQPLIEAGATTVRYQDSMESAIEIIKPLLHGRPFQPQLVKEMVHEKKLLKETLAGQLVNDNVEEAKRMHAAEIKQLEADKQEALRNQQLQYAQMLEEEKKDHAAKLVKLDENTKVLNKRVSGWGKFAQWVARTTVVGVGVAATIASGGWAAPAALLWSAGTEVIIDAIND